jgi:hypothetical protein
MHSSTHFEEVEYPKEDKLPTIEVVKTNEHWQKVKYRLQNQIILRYLEEFPASNINEWIEAYSHRVGEILEKEHHLLPDYEASMDKDPEVQEAIIQKIESELYQQK